MSKLMIEFHRVPHELQMYIESLKEYGDIVYYSESLPQILYLETPWEPDIIESLYGIKKVRQQVYTHIDPVRTGENRLWIDIMNVRYEREFEDAVYGN